MELYERDGRWHVAFYVVSHGGTRKRVRRSTGVAVTGKESSRARTESRRLAEQRATELARQYQMRQSGLSAPEADKPTLAVALTSLTRSSTQELGPDFFESVFQHFDPDAPAELIGSNELRRFASALVRAQLEAAQIQSYLAQLRAAVAQVADAPDLPERSHLISPDALFKTYFGQRSLRPSTLKSYRRVAQEFTRWCEGNDVDTAGDISVDLLALFASYLRLKPKMVVIKGGAKNTYRPSDQSRSPHSVNRELRSLAAMLSRLRKWRQLPHLRADDIADPLECEGTDVRLKPFLRVPEIRRLLFQAQQTPWGDFIRFLLLTGMRAFEAQQLEWSEVDLRHQLIRLDAGKVKIKRGRLIDLPISPSVVEMLKARPRAGSYVFGGEAPVGDLRYWFERLPFRGPQELRRTCSTYLCCMPSYGPHKSALRCGHSVTVAEQVYAGMVRLPPEATTLEAAMGIE